MKDQIRSAQIVLPCVNLNQTLEFFTERLGFRLEMIFPADSPRVAVVSAHGLTMRLESSSGNQTIPLTLQFVGNFAAETEHEIYSPDGVRILLTRAQSSIEIPDAKQEFILTTLDKEDSWNAGRAGMQYRDLIPGRLGGGFIASHIRLPDGGMIPDYVHYHKIRFQMIYCLSGWARLVYEDQGPPFVMNAGDCILQPPEIRHQVLETSAGFEVLEIGSPAVHETFADHQLKLPNETAAPEKIFSNQRFVHSVAEKADWNRAPREGFEWRNTGVFEASGGLADVRIFRAVADSRFSVNHSGEFLFFFVVRGNLDLSGGDKIYRLEKSDCFVLPAGDEYFVHADAGLELLRVSLPAEAEKF